MICGSFQGVALVGDDGSDGSGGEDSRNVAEISRSVAGGGAGRCNDAPGVSQRGERRLFATIYNNLR